MAKPRLIKTLKQLKNLESAGAPRGEWVKANKEILMMQIQNSFVYKPELKVGLAGVRQMLEHFLPSTAYVLRPSIAFSLVLAVVFGSFIFSVSASRESLPGDALYPLKIAAERARVTLTPTNKSKAKLQAEFAGRRLQEAVQAAASKSGDKKAATIKIALDSFRKQIESLKADLIRLQKQGQSEKVLEIIKIIDKTISEYKNILKDIPEAVELINGIRQIIK